MKRKLTNNFDKIAPVYDRLSRLVYGRSQMNAQIHQLKHLSRDSTILIAGGGTGWILQSIAEQYRSGLHIVYVEMSEKMIRIARAQGVGNNHIEFVHAAIEDYQTASQFDVVITPFLFCNFLEDTAAKVFYKLDSLLKPDGLWFITDFTTDAGKGKWWKMLLTKAMYTFFKSFGIVEGHTLNNMPLLFSGLHYLTEEEQFYYGKYIQAVVYRKPGT